MADLRAIMRNLRQWPTAAEPQGDFHAYVREQVSHVCDVSHVFDVKEVWRVTIRS